MKKFAALLVVFGCFTAAAQESSDTGSPVPQDAAGNDNMLTSLAGQFFEGDFVNYYAFFNGIYDSTQQTLQGQRNGSAGFSVGGGVTASKHFRSSLLSLNYRGDYRNYSGGFGSSGTNQYLSLVYSRRLSQRWTLSLTESAGMLLYSTAYFPTIGTGSGNVSTNPFSPSTRFLASNVYLSYRQTGRLTYTFGGSFFLNRYSYPGSIGSTGGIGSASASYALTARTTLGGTYSHSKFIFQHAAGNTDLDGGYFHGSHLFGRTLTVTASVGVTRTHTFGIISLPVQLILGGQPTVIGYVVGPYDTKRLVPSFNGGVIRNFKRFSLRASAGHGVNPGNGTYLTSSTTYFGGSFSKPLHNSALGANGFFNKVESIANKVSQGYSQSTISVSYSRILIPHLSTYVTYSYLRYGSLLNYGGTTDNRLVFGVSFSSKSIPLTIF